MYLDIHDAIKSILPNCKTPADLRFALQKFGVKLEYKHSRTTNKIEGVSFRYNDISFKGSQVDRKFSFENLEKEFEKNILTLQNTEQKEQVKQKQQPTIPTPKAKSNLKIGGIELINEQLDKLKSGDYIYLENMTNPQNGKPFSAYVATDNQLTKALFFKNPPDSFIKYGKYEMQLMDKACIEAGFITKAKVKWYGGGFAYPYLWKEKSTDIDYRENCGDPRKKEEEKVQKASILTTQYKKKQWTKNIRKKHHTDASFSNSYE